MKRNSVEIKRLDGKEPAPREEDVPQRGLGVAVFIIIALLLIGVTLVTAVVEHFGGKTAGTIAMAIIALAVAVILYRKEIASFFTRRSKNNDK